MMCVTYQWRTRKCVCIAGVFLLFLLAVLFRTDHPRKAFGRSDIITKHPITLLMTDANNNFINVLEKQSKTLPEAVQEYKRRYRRDPPRGFDHWWDFAKANGFKLVDEFDTIVEDLAPFWSLSGEELRWRAYQIGSLPSIDLVRIENGHVFGFTIEKGYVDAEGGARSKGFREMLENFQEKLPNMDFPINAKAEGRILIPWEHLHFANLNLHDSFGNTEIMFNRFLPNWQGHGGVWEAFRRTCPPGTPARRLYNSYRDVNVRPGKTNLPLGESEDSERTFTFAKTINNDFDYCKNPWAHYTQGHFFSDWRTISALYPVFSPAKADGFADIRIPSHYYYKGSQTHTYGWDSESRHIKEVDDMEMPWKEKSDRIFWRGSTTGGGSTPPGFVSNYQRHRFLRMAGESVASNVTIVHASPLRPDTFTSTSVPARDLNSDIMDVAFVKNVSSYPGGEAELRKAHRFAESVPFGKHWSYKYLIDLDGMSYSARFLAFLASDSAVIKSTVYKEYFSDWIQPWLHFIPLSPSYSEIYNIHAYFSGPSQSTMEITNTAVARTANWEAVKAERDGQLRQIANAGKEWKKTIGRTVDMEVYVYRLCLEYARLWADDRETMNFVL